MIARDFLLEYHIHSHSAILRKKVNSLSDLLREQQALLACKSQYIQEILSIDKHSLCLHLKYYDKAWSLLDFDEQEQSLFLQLIPKIINAIAHCHQQGWVHGDIKPSNILFLPITNEIKLIDFAAAYPLGQCRAKLTHWQVTKQFASFDHIHGKGLVSAKDDWLALLKILLQCRGENTEDKKKICRIQAWLKLQIVEKI